MIKKYLFFLCFVPLNISLYGMITVPRDLIPREDPEEEPTLGYTPSSEQDQTSKEEKEHEGYKAQEPKQRTGPLGMWENVYENILVDDNVPTAKRKDIYKQLGFPRNAAPTSAPFLGVSPFDRNDIIRKYRLLTLRFHPDKQPADNKVRLRKAKEIMQIITPAYLALIS